MSKKAEASRGLVKSFPQIRLHLRRYRPDILVFLSERFFSQGHLQFFSESAWFSNLPGAFPIRKSKRIFQKSYIYVALLGSQAFQRGFIRRNPPRDDEARLKSLEKSLESLRADLESWRAESFAVCVQRWSFRRRSLSWKTSFDWSEKKICAVPGVSSHPAVTTRPGFQIKWTQPDFHDFPCGPYLQLRIAVKWSPRGESAGSK